MPGSADSRRRHCQLKPSWYALKVGGGQLGICMLLRSVAGSSGSGNARRAYCPAPKSGDREERRQAQLVNVTMPVQAMRAKLKRAGRRSRYRLRKQIVEPVFGQVKQARGFRQFLLRGIDKVAAEWALICIAHNLNKLAAA